MTTLARSSDLACALPHVWVYHMGNQMVRIIAKGGVWRSFTISGHTAVLTTHYLSQTMHVPCTNLFRHYKIRSRPLTPDSISNICSRMMALAGIPSHYKVHAIRGAAATQLLANGLEPRIVQMRGGWLST